MAEGQQVKEAEETALDLPTPLRPIRPEGRLFARGMRDEQTIPTIGCEISSFFTPGWDAHEANDWTELHVLHRRRHGRAETARMHMFLGCRWENTRFFHSRSAF